MERRPNVEPRGTLTTGDQEEEEGLEKEIGRSNQRGVGKPREGGVLEAKRTNYCKEDQDINQVKCR